MRDSVTFQAKASLRDVHAQHARQPDRWTSVALAFWIARLDKLMKLARGLTKSC